MSFWDVFWLLVFSFFLVAYLIVLVQVVTDLFRDDELLGWWKALWVVCLIVLPVLTALVYLISRGKGMTLRQRADLTPSSTPGTQPDPSGPARRPAQSPAQEIAAAKALLDAGTITADEFEKIKDKALS